MPVVFLHALKVHKNQLDSLRHSGKFFQRTYRLAGIHASHYCLLVNRLRVKKHHYSWRFAFRWKR